MPLSDDVARGAERYFSSLLQTMLSLFMSISGGVSWEELAFPLQDGPERTVNRLHRLL